VSFSLLPRSSLVFLPALGNFFYNEELGPLGATCRFLLPLPRTSVESHTFIFDTAGHTTLRGWFRGSYSNFLSPSPWLAIPFSGHKPFYPHPPFVFVPSCSFLLIDVNALFVPARFILGDSFFPLSSPPESLVLAIPQ